MDIIDNHKEQIINYTTIDIFDDMITKCFINEENKINYDRYLKISFKNSSITDDSLK